MLCLDHANTRGVKKLARTFRPLKPAVAWFDEVGFWVEDESYLDDGDEKACRNDRIAQQ
jgi:hypothetical protein